MNLLQNKIAKDKRKGLELIFKVPFSVKIVLSNKELQNQRMIANYNILN